MRVPLSWLREYCDPPLDAPAIAERLTMTGTKVETIHHHGVRDPTGFLVGRVLQCEAHPDADRLRVCRVDLGPARPEGPATIVCGAPNVAAGQTVAVATPGACMPDGSKLRAAKLRGVASEGMILAEDELEIGTGHDGIMVLDELIHEGAELEPGMPLVSLLPLLDEVLELEITTNRPDCLGLYAIARELHAATGAPLSPAPWLAGAAAKALLSEQEDLAATGEVALGGLIPLAEEAPIQVSVRCPELCPRFTARLFDGVTVGPSPLWLKGRLMAAGQRPINNVVDITNYVMLLTGQPMHAFDLDRVVGHSLIVRRASEGERVLTLDGQTRDLDTEMVVIEDGEGPTSIAGLMGGARSEVHAGTKRVLLEAACWDGANIHRASLLLGLRSEASLRFEKGLAPEQCLHAQAVAGGLLAKWAGADSHDQAIDLGWQPTPAPVIRLRSERVTAILGLPVSEERQEEILSSLDFSVQPASASGAAAGALDVAVPAVRRSDVTREIDLIEEIARIDGLERLPTTLPPRRGAAGRLSHAQRVRRKAEDALAARGLHEIVGWSFADPELLERLMLADDDPLRRVVALENPLSEAQSVLRPTLLGSLMDAARHNLARGATRIAIFESGRVYRAALDGPLADEHHALGVLLTGSLEQRSWRAGPSIESDFFAAKGLLEALLGTLRVQWSVAPFARPFLHPGRAAAVHGPTGQLGFIGELHPLVAARWDLGQSAAFALDLDKIAEASPENESFAPFASVPPIRRDLAVTIGAQTSAGELIERVRAAGGELLEDVHVFDVYTGEQVGAGSRSLALALTFQAPEKTLTDEEVAPLLERIRAAVTELGGELRG